MGYGTYDVGNGLTLISSFISSMEAEMKNEKYSLSKKISCVEKELENQKHQYEQLTKEKAILEKERSDLQKK